MDGELPGIVIGPGVSPTDTAPYDDKKTIEQKATQEWRKLQELARVDNQPLVQVTGTFPFEFFPTTITVDRKKVTVYDRVFFFNRAIQSLLIEDLMSVRVETGILFATLRVVDKHYPGEDIVVRFLPKQLAKEARWVIEGLMVAQKEKIDLTYIPREELSQKLLEIGKTQSEKT